MKQLLIITYKNGNKLSHIVYTDSVGIRNGGLSYHVWNNHELVPGIPLENISGYTICRYFDTIEKLEDASGISLKSLSVSLGIPYRTLQGWKSGERVPPTYMMQLICSYMNIQ